MSAVINYQEANSETAKMNFREDLDEMQQLRAIREHRDSVRHQVAMSNWHTTRASHTSHRYMLHMLVEEARRYTTENHYNSAEGHDDGDEKAAAVGVNEDVNNDAVADDKSSQQSNESTAAVEGGDIVAKDPNHNDNADDNLQHISTPRPKQPRSPPMIGSPSTSLPTVHDELHHHIDALMMQQDNYQEALHCITHLRLFSRKVEEERSDSSNDGDANAAEETTPPQQS